MVFINVPLDTGYEKLCDAIVFAAQGCGFVARCALEEDDGSRVRVEKLDEIIRERWSPLHRLCVCTSTVVSAVVARETGGSTRRRARCEIGWRSDIVREDIPRLSGVRRRARAPARELPA